MKYIIYTFAFLLISGFLSAQDIEKPKKPKKLLKNAEKFMKSGDVYSAIDNYEDYVDMVEDDYVIANRLGEAYLLARDYLKAESTFKRIFDADPENYRKAQYFHSLCMMHTATTEIDKQDSDADQSQRETLLQEAIGKYEEAKKNFKIFSKKYRGSDKSAYKKKVKMHMLGCDIAISKLKKPDPMIKQHLDTNINRAYTDMSPLPIGKNKLVFSSMRSDTIVFVDSKDTEAEPFTAKLYVAEREDTNWIFKGEFENVFNERGKYIGNGVFSRDKTKFFYSKCEESDEGRILCDIWYSEKDSGKWQTPQPLSANVNTKKYTETQPAIGYYPKKKLEILYFVSDREEGSRGGYDIWYTYFDKKKTKEWVTPVNCKTKINTAGNEMTPSYDLESNTMYFSSDYWPGMGGLDVFRSQGGMKRWSGKPKNIGFPLNSGADDLYYVVDETGESGYFSSNRTGGFALKNPTCCDDIYYFRWLNLIRVFTEGIVLDEDDETETPLTDAVVSLYLEDPETGEEVLIKTDTTKELDLDYLFKLQPHKRYKLSAYKKGYFTGFTKISTKGVMKSDTMRAANILLKKIPPKDSTITIKNIYYEFDKADVTSASKDTLEKNLLGFLQDNPTIVIEIGAHTDSKGSELYNMQLSQKRAESVVQFLVDKGVMEKRLIPVGYGESKPIAKNKNEDGSDNPEGREKNRRTEFKVMNELPENLVIDYEE